MSKIQQSNTHGYNVCDLGAGVRGQDLISGYILSRILRFLYKKRMACPWRIEYESALFVANGCLNFARPAPCFGVGFFTSFPENMWINICPRFWRSKPQIPLQHLCTFRGRKKVVISSFPDFRGKVQAAAIYLNIWHHLNFYDIHLKSNIFSELTPTLQKPEGFRVKASEGEVVVLYFEPSATQNLKSSGFPEG